MYSDNTSDFYRMRLPHWEVKSGNYFVTIRVAGSLPKGVLRELYFLHQELQTASGDVCEAIKRRAFVILEASLDSAHAPQHLANDALARAVMEAIAFREETKVWTVGEFAILPNHIHIFFTLHSGSLREVLTGFKRWTTREAHRIGIPFDKRLWQREWFDHWSRSHWEDRRIADYIRNNPVKAGLVSHYRDWPYGSWSWR